MELLETRCLYCGDQLESTKFEDHEIVDSKTGKKTGEVLRGKWMIRHPKNDCLIRRTYVMADTFEEALEKWNPYNG